VPAIITPGAFAENPGYSSGIAIPARKNAISRLSESAEGIDAGLDAP